MIALMVSVCDTTPLEYNESIDNMALPPVGVQIYFLVSGVMAAVTHWRLKRYVVATILSAAIAPFAFALVCLLHGEAIYAVKIIFFIFFCCISLGISAMTGLPFLVYRIRKSGAQRSAMR